MIPRYPAHKPQYEHVHSYTNIQFILRITDISSTDLASDNFQKLLILCTKFKKGDGLEYMYFDSIMQ